jgi:hypothetical protein
MKAYQLLKLFFLSSSGVPFQRLLLLSYRLYRLNVYTHTHTLPLVGACIFSEQRSLYVTDNCCGDAAWSSETDTGFPNRPELSSASHHTYLLLTCILSNLLNELHFPRNHR